MVAWRGRAYKGTQGNFGIDGHVTILLVVLVSWAHTDVKTYQIGHFKYTQLTHTNYTSKKLKKKKKRPVSFSFFFFFLFFLRSAS